MELGAVHRLSDSDPVTSPSCHRIPGNPPANRKAAGHLGGGKTRNSGRGHAVSVRGVTNRRPEGGDGRTPG